MPEFIKTPKDEAIWASAKEAISRNMHIPESKFTDKHWSMVNGLFQKIKTNKKIKEKK